MAQPIRALAVVAEGHRDSAAMALLAEVRAGGIELVDALDPERLSAQAEDAMRELLASGESANTVRAYRSALRYWEAWFALRYRQAIELPVPVATVRQFILDHAERATAEGLRSELPPDVDAALIQLKFKKEPGTLSLATLNLRLSALSRLHDQREIVNPCRRAEVKEALSRTRRGYAKRGVIPNKKAAITLEPLTAMLNTCDKSLAGLRDRALILFAWSSGGRRRSEVAQATMENVVRRGPRQYVFLLGHSKTDQSGQRTQDQAKPVVDEAADALDAWLAASGIVTGPIFRRVLRHEKVGGPLAPAAVRDIVMRRAALAGLEGYSAHSLRSGFVTEAAEQGISLAETMQMTGHTSVQTVVGYFRTKDKLTSKAARLFKAKSKAGEDVAD